MRTHMGMAWGPHGHSNGPPLEFQGAQRVAKGEPTWNPMGIKWAPKDPNVDIYVCATHWASNRDGMRTASALIGKLKQRKNHAWWN